MKHASGLVYYFFKSTYYSNSMFNLILAMDENLGIGKNNSLPWNIPEDMKNFKKVTTGSTVIMGKNTAKSIGKPLKNRINIVISKTEYLENFINVQSVKEAISCALYTEKPIFIIGGAQLYNDFLLRGCQKIYLTLVKDQYECDTFVSENFHLKILLNRYNIESQKDTEKCTFYILNLKF